MNIITLCGEITFVSKIALNKEGRKIFWFGLDSDDTLRYLDSNDNIKEQKIYHTVILYDDFAEEVIKNLMVGQVVEVIGRLAFSKIVRGKNSEILPRIVGNEVKIMTKKNLRNKNEGSKKNDNKKYMFKEKDIDISELPFD